MEEKKRRKYRNLACCGGLPEMAAESFREFTFDEYNEVVQSGEFKEWFNSYIKTFNEFFDGVLLGDLFALRNTLATMNPADRTYPRVYAQYIKLIDRTAPIVDRLRRATGQDPVDTGDYVFDVKEIDKNAETPDVQ